MESECEKCGHKLRKCACDFWAKQRAIENRLKQLGVNDLCLSWELATESEAK